MYKKQKKKKKHEYIFRQGTAAHCVRFFIYASLRSTLDHSGWEGSVFFKEGSTIWGAEQFNTVPHGSERFDTVSHGREQFWLGTHWWQVSFSLDF